MRARIAHDRFNLHLQTDRLALDDPEATPLRIDPVFALTHDFLKHKLKTRERHILKELVEIHRLRPLRDLFRQRGFAEKDLVGVEFAIGEFLRHQLVLFVLQQAAHKFRSRVHLFAGLLIHLARQEHARLDVEQGRRHQKELRELIEILPLHAGEIRHILLRNLGNRNVVDIDFILLNQL